MTQEQTEKAAENYIKNWLNDCIKFIGKDSFINGANWRINSIWHTYAEAKDIEFGNDVIIAFYPNNIYRIGTVVYTPTFVTNPKTGITDKHNELAIKYYKNMCCLLSKCIKWAYVKDLLP